MNERQEYWIGVLVVFFAMVVIGVYAFDTVLGAFGTVSTVKQSSPGSGGDIVVEGGPTTSTTTTSSTTTTTISQASAPLMATELAAYFPFEGMKDDDGRFYIDDYYITARSGSHTLGDLDNSGYGGAGQNWEGPSPLYIKIHGDWTSEELAKTSIHLQVYSGAYGAENPLDPPDYSLDICVPLQAGAGDELWVADDGSTYWKTRLNSSNGSIVNGTFGAYPATEPSDCEPEGARTPENTNLYDVVDLHTTDGLKDDDGRQIIPHYFLEAISLWQETIYGTLTTQGYYDGQQPSFPGRLLLAWRGNTSNTTTNMTSVHIQGIREACNWTASGGTDCENLTFSIDTCLPPMQDGFEVWVAMDGTTYWRKALLDDAINNAPMGAVPATTPDQCPPEGPATTSTTSTSTIVTSSSTVSTTIPDDEDELIAEKVLY